MQQIQELAHKADHDYDAGSPHLKHRHLNGRLVAMLRAVLGETRERSLPPTLLEIGAGDGAFTEPVLAAGFRVTATEMSRPAIATLEERFGGNPAFTALHVRDESAYPITDGRFSVILCASVIHHIPDYGHAIDQLVTHHLEPGGTFVSVQDPLWYPSLSRGTRLLGTTAYLSWRMTRGDYRRGVATRVRRLRSVYDDTNVADTAEYHVVRHGVDHRGLVEILSARFESVNLSTYWSTQSTFWQRVGDRTGTANTFALVARGYRDTAARCNRDSRD